MRIRLGFLFLAAVVIFLSAARGASGGSGEGLEADLLGEDPAALAETARELGDPARGAVLFHRPELGCTRCHSAGAGERPLGPDLARAPEGTTAAGLAESVLRPSKTIREGFEATALVLRGGDVLTGRLLEPRGETLRLLDSSSGEERSVPRRDVAEISGSDASIMPAGLVQQLASRREFLDLLAYLIEIAEKGPARASELEPPPELYALSLPEYESRIDHAGFIASFDEESFERGRKIYERVCANCHGTRDEPGSLPAAPPFASHAFKNGSDPYSMYRTLTYGFGYMAPQAWMVPRQKYDAIHYVREAYLRRDNPSMYVPVDDGYLRSLPAGDTRGPPPSSIESWVNADYGPTLINTYEVGSDGSNFAYKGIAVRLDQGAGGISRGSCWVIFDHDTLRLAAAWSGRGFIDWNGIHFNGRHQVHPRIVGELSFENPSGPGWADPETGRFDERRLRGRDGRRYGPLPREWARYRGLYHHGRRAIIAYTVGRAEVLEMPGLVKGEETPVFTRAFRIEERDRELILQAAHHPDAEAVLRRAAPEEDADRAGMVLFGAAGNAESAPRDIAAGIAPAVEGARWSAEGGDLRLHLPAGEGVLAFTLWIGRADTVEEARSLAGAVAAEEPPDLEVLTGGGPARWREALSTRAVRGGESGPFAVDVLAHPVQNPWNVQMRLSGLDFFPGEDRAAVSTWDGDVWTVSGLEDSENRLTWRRIASGLFQPLGLKVFEGRIYVSCRDQIALLHDLDGDGETDFYESFNNDHQVTDHFHEFAMGLQTDAEGRFYYAKAARHALPALVPHHGTLLRVSADGRRTDILATGFRAPNGVCLNPDGTFFITDQEGHWTPKNRINRVREGGFYGNMWGYHDVTDASDASMEPPLCWITNEFDRSPAEPVWIASESWGPLRGALLNLSYGYGRIFVVLREEVDGVFQGGVSPLPIRDFPTGIIRGRFRPEDGHLYTCGLFAWAGNQQQPGGFYRVRATGKPLHVPVELHARAGGLAIAFSAELDGESVNDPGSYVVRTWSIRRSARYGSDRYDEKELEVEGAMLEGDGRTVFLRIPDIRPTRCMEIRYRLRGAGGERVESAIHNTIHALGGAALTE